MKKIYIAGFDVFKKDSIEIGKQLQELCKKEGYNGLYPLDNVANFNQPKQKIAQEIFAANKSMIEESDIVIANMNPFRGKEPDSGTVWECGYASALGKKVYGYKDSNTTYIDAFSEDEITLSSGCTYDCDEMMIEDFEYPVNLMIACSSHIVEGNFKSVLDYIKNEKTL